MSLIGLYSHQDCPSILLSFQSKTTFAVSLLLSCCPTVHPWFPPPVVPPNTTSFTFLHFWQSLNDNIISITVQCSTSITAQGKQWEGIPKMIRIVFLMHCPMDIFFHLICRSLKFVCSWFLPTRPQNLQVFQSSPKPCDTSSRIPYNLIPSSSHPISYWPIPACNSHPNSQQALLSHRKICTVHSDGSPGIFVFVSFCLTGTKSAQFTVTDGPGQRETKKEPRGKLQTSRYLHVKTPPQLLVKIEKTHWGWPSILQISSSCLCICSVLCDLLCRKNASLLGRRGQICPASLLRNSHPKEAIEAIGHPHLEVVEGHSRLEEGGVSQNPRLPKIPRIPATSVWDLRNLGGYPGFKGFWSSNSDLEL